VGQFTNDARSRGAGSGVAYVAAMLDARALLSDIANGPIAEIEDDIFDLAPSAPPLLHVAHYDRMGWLYDAVCGTAAYGNLVWGAPPHRSRDFAEQVFASRDAGPHVEVGCGSLLFTAPLYDRDRGRPVILVDQSLEMLRMARARLRTRIGRMPSYVALVRGDARGLPFAPAFATTVLSMHVLHVVDDRESFLKTLAALAAPRVSTIAFTSLVTTGSFRDAFLSMLHRAGELSSPVSALALERLARASLPGSISIERAGNMTFVMTFVSAAVGP
jgi:SAM-dependent methyltransferase